MTALCFLDRFCGKETQGIYSQVINIHIVFPPISKIALSKKGNLHQNIFWFPLQKDVSYFLGTLSQSFRKRSIPMSVRGCFAIWISTL